MQRPIARAALGVLLVLVITACGSSGAAPATSGGSGGGASGGGGSGVASPPPQGAGGNTGAVPAIDACALLSDEELEAATGQRVTKRTASTLTQVFPSVCDLAFDEGAQLTVSIMASGGRSMYEESFEPFIGENELLEETVTDLGDKAGRSGDDYLMVLAGDTLFDLQYLEFWRADKARIIRYLAETVLAKLPCIADGCVGFTPPPPPVAAEATDACALLTPEEIEEATSFPVTSTEPGDGRCRWGLDTGSFAGVDGLEIVILDQGGRSQFDFWADGFYEVPPEHLPDLGDDAIKTGTIPAGSIHAVVGDRLVSFNFSMPLSVTDPYGRVAPLAEVALERLP